MLEHYGQNGGHVHREGCGYCKTGLHGILFISTVDLLQPPPTTVHPRAPIHPASTARYSIGYCSTSPLHTGSCSTTPPRATVHAALHRPLFIQPAPLLHRLLFNHPSPWGPVQPPLHGLLFIQPSTGYCSTSPPRGPVHPAPTGSIDRGPVHLEATPRGPVHPPPLGTVHPNPPNNVHCSSIGSIDRLRLEQ